MKKMGRPPKSDGECKSYRTEIRLNQQQNDLLTGLCEEYSMSKTDLILLALEKLSKKKRR